MRARQAHPLLSSWTTTAATSCRGVSRRGSGRTWCPRRSWRRSGASGSRAKLPPTAAEDFVKLVMRCYEKTSTVHASNCPVEDWGNLLGDTAAVTALLYRILHHAHVIKAGPRSWRTLKAVSLRNRENRIR